jgi:ankyrin repeat protein
MSATRSSVQDEFVIEQDNAPVVMQEAVEPIEAINLDKSSEYEDRLLQRAEVFHKAEVVAGLFKHKRQINLQDKDGRTLLHYAAWFGEPELINYLLKQEGIQVNLTDERGLTALHHAAFHGNAATLAELLKHKEIDVNQLDKEGKAPLRLGICCADVVAELMKHEDVNVNLQDEFGKTPLHYAAEFDMGKSVAELLAHKDIKINLTDNKGWTPLALAGYHHNGYAVSELLKDKNLLVNLKEKYDWKAVCAADTKGYAKIVKQFLCSYIANYYNRREKEGAYLTTYGRFFGIHQEAKLAAAGFLLNHLGSLDKLEQLDEFNAHKPALEDGELGNIFSLLKK